MAEILDALVVGGGPTGLTMAGELVRRGLSVRLVDKALEPPPDHSRALAVQARTLELFDMMGIAEPAVERGVRVGGINVLLSDGRRARLPLLNFPELSTRFPHVFFTVPRRWGLRLPLDEGPPAITITSAIPISDREYRHWKEGGDDLAQRLATVDTADLARPDVV